MEEIKKLHHEAMNFADAADLAQRRGELDLAESLHRRAFEKEREAANKIAGDDHLEPTRSVLHRSAASLAFICKEFREAERLIAHALSAEPPPEVADELRDLLERVNFQRHLSLREIVLQPDEFQISLSGSDIGFGIAPTEQVFTRVRYVETLIHRTAERHLKVNFRERGRPKKGTPEIYMSAPRAASFAITFRLGTEQLSLPSMDSSKEIITELLDCFDLLNRGEMEDLHGKIPDKSYFHNFVGLAQKIAPDGKQVRLVGFTASTINEERTVAFTRTKSKISGVISNDDSKTLTRDLIEIRGVLLQADATKKKTGRIEIVDINSKIKYTVQVPRGMMSDIVKPMFEEYVIVTGFQEENVIILNNIDFAEPENSD